jgi:hypothetical protein
MLWEDTFVSYREISINGIQLAKFVLLLILIGRTNIINIPWSEIKGLTLSTFFLSLIRTQTRRSIDKVGEERGIVCSHMDA